MTQQNPWEDYDWDLMGDANHKQVHHLTIQDLRRYIFLATEGLNAVPSKAVFAAQVEDGPKRFAASWQDTLWAYPDADIVYSTSTPPTPSEYVSNVQYPEQRPGSMTVYFERSISHPLQGVTTDTVSTGEFIFNATLVQKYGIYNENGSTIDIDGTLESWYKEQDDFRPGTPFIIKNSANEANDGFYRVRSVRQSGDYVYVTPDNNNYEQQELVACSAGGTATCDFGGDWYTFVGMNGNSLSAYNTGGGAMSGYFSDYGDSAYLGSIRNRWWSVKDMYHRYAQTSGEVTFGPNDGRPPTGGQESKDFNADWVRCPNPSRPHTYDRNSHRFHVEAEEDGSITGGDYEQFTALIPSYKFLCFDADPKEQESPFFFEDTNRVHWKYGKKVRFRARDITNPSKLGAIQAVRSTGYTPTNNPPVGTGSDHQYNSTYTRTINNGEMCEDGYLPVISGQSYMSKWINAKYDDALQNMIELAATRHSWVWPVDNDYKYNWIWVNKYNRLTNAHREYLEYAKELEDGALQEEINGEMYNPTYWSIYTTYGLSDAYMPKHNINQREYDYMNAEYWGENGSAFELILKLLGSSYYDWYYDETYPYRSKNILDTGWEWAAGMDEDDYTWPVTFNGIECNSINDIREACWQIPVGVWRRTWKYTYGRVKDCKMRDGSRDVPGGFPTAADGGDWPYEFYYPDDTSGNKTIRMIGRVVMEGDEPADSEFYSWSESGWTVPDTEQPNTIRFSGDKTDRFKTGNVVWTKISSEYYVYYVLKVVYDSTGNTTAITLSSDFSTDSPAVLYGDINLSATHDPAFVVNKTPCYPTDRLPTILQHCRNILKKLKYKDLVVTLSLKGKQISLDAYDLEYPSKEALRAAYELEFENEWNPDMSTWGTWSSGTWFGHLVEYFKPGETWHTYDSHYSECALYISDYDNNADLLFDENAVSFLVRLGFRKTASMNYSPTKIGIVGKTTITPPESDAPYNYVYISVGLNDGYIRIYCLGDFANWVKTQDDPEVWLTATITNIILDQLGELDFIAEFDWAKYPDAIWDRTHERADYRLIDSFGPDNEPPKKKNEWVIEPTLYDANFPEFYNQFTADAYPYDNPNYTPQWKIKAEAVLMEDLESNGVEYIFDCEHDTYSTTADLMDYTGANRKYDKALNMGVGSNAGDSDDAWAAYDALIGEWEFTLNSKDCYSGSVAGEDDNYGTPTAAANITFDCPMFPIRPRIESEKIQVDTVWYDHIWTDAPLCNNSVEYRLEVWDTVNAEWSVLYDYGATNPTPPAGGNDGDSHFYLSGPEITEISVDNYRLRYRNANTEKSGMYSDETQPAPATMYNLNIRNTDGRTITLNGETLTSFPHNVDLVAGTKVTLYSPEFEGGWINYSSWPWQSFTVNPLEFYIYQDFDIQCFQGEQIEAGLNGPVCYRLSIESFPVDLFINIFSNCLYSFWIVLICQP